MRSSFGRMFTTMSVILLSAMLLLGAVFRAIVKDYIRDNATEKLQKDARVIADLAAVYGTTGRGLGDEDFLVNLTVASQVSDADAVICNSAGRILLCSDEPFGAPYQDMSINMDYVQKVQKNNGDVSVGVFKNLYEETRYLVSEPILDQSSGDFLGIVIVSTPIVGTGVILKQITGIFLCVSLLVVLAAVIFAAITARQQSKPLQAMSDAATAFGHGDLDARVQVDEDASDDVSGLAIAFNNMASSLQKSEYQRQEFVANVSHELKTPMTTISGYVDGILDGTIPPEKQRHYLQIVSDETKRLSRLVRSMLDISQLQNQAGIPEERKSRFDMTERAGQVLITFEQKILMKKLNVVVDMPEHPVYTRADQDAVTQVIYNLLDNAVKFSPEGGTLGLTVQESSSKVYVSVSNEGDTIPPEELPLVFDRFHKTDKSRSQHRDGWGLGLYIVKSLVCCHGENISVTSRDGKTEFTFTMPLVI